MSKVELHERYPMSRHEDITDAYMRGFQASITIMCDPLRAENDALRKELEMEREDNGSIRRLFDAVAPRCGKPDCPSLVEYVEKLRELCKDMWRTAMANMDFADRYAFAGEFNERMRELGVEVVE